MARGWQDTKLSLSNAHFLPFSGMSFCRFFFVFMPSLKLCSCFFYNVLFSRPRFGLATVLYPVIYAVANPVRSLRDRKISEQHSRSSNESMKAKI